MKRSMVEKRDHFSFNLLWPAHVSPCRGVEPASFKTETCRAGAHHVPRTKPHRRRPPTPGKLSLWDA